MIRIILFFFLLITFPTLLFSKEILSARIEGFYIMESLLTYYTKEEIQNAYNYDHLPSDMRFRISEFEANRSSSYDVFQFYHIPSDEKYIIHGIRAAKFCESKKVCKSEFNKMDEYLSSIFDNKDKVGPYTKSHIDDPSGKSKFKVIEFNLSDGLADVSYTDWSNEVIYDDSVSVSISSRDVEDWLRDNYGVD